MNPIRNVSAKKDLINIYIDIRGRDEFHLSNPIQLSGFNKDMEEALLILGEPF